MECVGQMTCGGHCECTIYSNTEYTLRSPPEPGSDVCLYFGGEEYEGLQYYSNSTFQYITLSKDDHLYDVGNDEIPIRNLIYYFKILTS